MDKHLFQAQSLLQQLQKEVQIPPLQTQEQWQGPTSVLQVGTPRQMD
jgi:hypothetical protein